MLRRLGRHESINFYATNLIPRRLATYFVGWISRIEHPWVRDTSIALWRTFSDLNLEEALDTQFASLRDVFVRKLKPDARPICAEPHVLVSPCDAIVGAHGHIAESSVLQAKGFPYTLHELLLDPKSSMSIGTGPTRPCG